MSAACLSLASAATRAVVVPTSSLKPISEIRQSASGARVSFVHIGKSSFFHKEHAFASCILPMDVARNFAAVRASSSELEEVLRNLPEVKERERQKQLEKERAMGGGGAYDPYSEYKQPNAGTGASYDPYSQPNAGAGGYQSSGFDSTSSSGYGAPTQNVDPHSKYNQTNEYQPSPLSTSPDGFAQPPPPPAGTKLYVGNLPWTCNSERLSQVFEGCGQVEMVEVIYDQETGRSRGFGFVTMATTQDAEAAIAKLDGTDMDGRAIKVNYPNPYGSSPRPARSFGGGGGGGGFDGPRSKCFVGNLPWGMDDVSLEELFTPHGKVLEAKVIYDRETGRSRGFGFVTYSSPDEANEAVNSLNGADCEGRALRVLLAEERPRF